MRILSTICITKAYDHEMLTDFNYQSINVVTIAKESKFEISSEKNPTAT